MRSGRHGTRGQMVVVFALSVSMLVGMLGLVVDLGEGENQQRLAQNAADASVLAAGQNIAANSAAADFSGATTAGNSAATANLAGATVVYAWLNSAQSAGVLTPAATYYVKATVSGTQKLYFTTGRGPSITVSATATAKIPKTACGICVLGSAGTTLQWNNNVIAVLDAVVVNGSIDTNGNMAANGTLLSVITSLTASPGPILVGGTNTVGGLLWSESPTPTTGAAQITDPLSGFSFSALVPIGTTVRSTVVQNITTNTTLQPGYYNGINVSNSAVVTLAPGGTFYIGGGGIVGGAQGVSCILFVCGGNGINNQINGTGVTIALGCGGAAPVLCPAGGAGSGGFSQGTTTTVTLTAPTSGALKNMLIFGDPNNTATVDFPAVNQSSTPVQGAIDLPKGTLTMTDASGLLGNTTINSMIDVGSFTFVIAITTSTVTFNTGGVNSSPLSGGGVVTLST